jgi:hypothetical protein
MNRVMTPFQQWFGKPCLCRATLSVWEKVEEYEGLSSEKSNNISNTDLCCGCCFHWTITTKVCGETWSAELRVLHLTMFDHKRDLVMKTFWPVFVIELSDTDMRLCHKACALLLEWFLVALSHGQFSFQMIVHFTGASNLEMFFEAKYNPCYTIQL